MWARLLDGTDKELVHIRSSVEFDQFASKNTLNDFYYLFDLELLNSDHNGLDLVEKYKLNQHFC